MVTPPRPDAVRWTPPGTWDGAAADAALAAGDAAVGDAAASLVALESHRGSTLLRTWPLTGASARRWGRATAAVAGLHADLERYRALLARAREARGTRARPSADELGRVAALLYGESIELGVEEIPLSRRPLVGAATVTHRIRPAALLARMQDAFAAVGATVEHGAAVWDAVGARLDPLDAALDRAEQDAGQDAGQDADRDAAPDVARRREELLALRREALADPLDRDPAHPLDEARTAAVEAGIAEVVAALAARAVARAGLGDRLTVLGAALDALAADEQAAVEAAALVARAIDTRGASLPSPHPRAAELRARRDELAATAGGDRDGAVAACAALENAVAGARDRAHADHEVLSGLVARRGELRGRLSALSAKAAARAAAGGTERPLDALRRDAEDQLWSAPCDLVAATVALRRYQRALEDPADTGEEAT